MAKQAKEPDRLSDAAGGPSSSDPDAAPPPSQTLPAMPQAYIDRAAELKIELPADGYAGKGVLAKLEGVSAPAVSKWVREGGKLYGQVPMKGEGRRALLHLPSAREQLKATTNINQTWSQRETPAAKQMAFSDPGQVADQTSNHDDYLSAGETSGPGSDTNQSALEEAKVKTAQMNALFAEKRAMAETGQWIALGAHERAVSKIVTDLVVILENLPVMIGEQLASLVEGMDQQSIVTTVDKIVRKQRGSFAEQARRRAEEMSEQG